MRRALPALLLLTTACSAGTAPVAKPSPTPTVAPTAPAEARLELSRAAAAEETYFSDNAAYTTDISALNEATGYAPRIQLEVLSADADGYCLSYTLNTVWYLSSYNLKYPSQTKC